jgi:DNA-binding Lrp family transcriptional regulator
MNSSSDSVVAFILLVTASNETQSVFNELKENEKVLDVFMIYGDFDLILKVELPNLGQMTSFMMDLRNRFAIKKSSTLITLAE